MARTEEETAAAAHAVIMEGAAARRSGAACPYAANTLRSFLFAQGWLTEDLRIALMRADPAYETGQANFGQGISHQEPAWTA